ncbi:hypothetical protein BZM27_06135 [Paraburkholderia steynii]|uniref:KilA-N domain-containing protein n=1 Tax=Paraburkholderia steynii TaxID=1245441 RepID=A0A4R0XFV2_9BURK|nr:hypothetical protein BZM27_06135 [Paraburkholderia steynii]
MAPKQQIIVADYQGVAVSFTDEGWFNATAIASQFGKRPNDWLALPATQEYIAALDESLNTGESGNWIRTLRGKSGGTWLHPDLAVGFARWLDVRFAIWCDRQIRALITRQHPHFDQKRLRHEAAASYKVMSQIVQLSREAIGKTCAPHHFSNEARLVNWAASGKFQSLERDSLSTTALDLLARLEERNAVMIGLGKDYDERKASLQAFATVWTANHAANLTVALGE